MIELYYFNILLKILVLKMIGLYYFILIFYCILSMCSE